ncbi:EAL domain-containing protein [Hydrogenovibrio sp. 3SP14C1]|uniref:EAL domain-containing protein n=1 Tax=Hydrogenovibrio sp. 3SP14C1 TaxID=3038774 RepID=UPI0024170980|nr:EAL domain-containing protein [Hydrogenovibrio sp. 3SP14C1]MDG4811576.1 EAL domain-containing protein [Hydrogenovibrio sp. 3SP14C1]
MTDHPDPEIKTTLGQQPLVVSQFMHMGLETCAPDTCIKTVISYLNEKKIGSILIEDAGEIVGIWTRSDLLKLDLFSADILENPISSVMNSPVCRIHKDELISSATYLFHKKQFHHLLVVDCDETPIGVLAESDLVQAQSCDAFLDGITIQELLAGHLFYIQADSGLDQVLSMMSEHNVDALVVKDVDQLGIVSMRDLLKCFAQQTDYQTLKVKDIASWPLISVSHSQSLSSVRQFMIQHNFHHIGVEDEKGKLLDLISFSELLHRIEENFYFQASLSIKEKEQRILEAETLYRDLLSMSLNGIIIYQDDKIAFANHAIHQLLGYEDNALLESCLLNLIPPAHQTLFMQRLQEIDQHHPDFIEQTILSQNGSEVRVEMTHKPITYHAEPAHLIVVNDLSFRKESERFQMLTRSVFDNAGEGILVTDIHNRFVVVNKKFEEITGYRQEEVIGKNPSILSSGQQSILFYQAMWQELNDKDTWQGEVLNRKKDGTIYPEWLTINAVKDKEGRLLHYVGLMNDLSQQKATEQEINRLSFYDILTGLPNVSLFKNRLQQSIQMSVHESNQVALLIVDIARFKMINDAIGYEHGDQLLKGVAQRLNQLLDAEDSVARLGADNFLILMESFHHKQDVSNFAEEIINTFLNPFEVEGHEHVLDIKIGIALSAEDGDSALDLMKSADEALFEAKKLPHNGYVYHSSELATTTSEYFFYEKALRQAIDNNELIAYYQPQIVFETNQVIGAEALVRWIHPEMGIISPVKFIGIAESTGLIIPLGREILFQACQQWLAWQKQGLSLERISVNVSTVQLMHQGFVQSVAQVLEETGLDPKYLELEVTESFLLQNEQEGIAVLHALKALGISLSMDDFGTGFSSLSYLKKLPLDQLKIDQSFIRSLPHDKEDLAIVDAIIAVGLAVNVEVIAEGVETEAQMKYLHNKGCQLGQGYGFSPPIKQEDFLQWCQTFQS